MSAASQGSNEENHGQQKRQPTGCLFHFDRG
jgi:hypothetical protein